MPLYTESIPVLTDASGNFTGYCGKLQGKYLDKVYVDYIDLTSGAADIIISDEDSGAVLLTLSDITADSISPVRFQNVGNTGSGISGSYSAWRTNGRLKVEVVSGGNAKTAHVHFYLADEAPLAA